MSEKKLSTKFNYNVTTDHDTFKEINASSLFQQPILKKLRFIHSAGFYWSFDTPLIFYKSGQAASVNLFPSDFLSYRLVGASTGLEHATFKTKSGIISTYAVYQCAVAKDFDDDYVFNQGVGAGAKIYFSKLAFPACALEIIYNITEDDFKTGFTLGVSM